METSRQNSTVSAKPKKNLWSYFDPQNKKHRYILSLCIQYGWRKPHPTKSYDIANLERLDSWMRSDKCPVKKPLKEQAPRELSKIIVALENMIVKSN